MAIDIDQPPINDPLTKRSADSLSDIWRDYIAALIDTLTGYLSQYGMLTPNVTTAERDSIQSPQNGQLIFNTTLDTMQYYKVSSGTWISF